jgi:hypothetical protein
MSITIHIEPYSVGDSIGNEHYVYLKSDRVDENEMANIESEFYYGLKGLIEDGSDRGSRFEIYRVPIEEDFEKIRQMLGEVLADHDMEEQIEWKKEIRSDEKLRELNEREVVRREGKNM